MSPPFLWRYYREDLYRYRETTRINLSGRKIGAWDERFAFWYVSRRGGRCRPNFDIRKLAPLQLYQLTVQALCGRKTNETMRETTF